jgi:hypothetical protein
MTMVYLRIMKIQRDNSGINFARDWYQLSNYIRLKTILVSAGEPHEEVEPPGVNEGMIYSTDNVNEISRRYLGPSGRTSSSATSLASGLRSNGRKIRL